MIGEPARDPESTESSRLPPRACVGAPAGMCLGVLLCAPRILSMRNCVIKCPGLCVHSRDGEHGTGVCPAVACAFWGRGMLPSPLG